MTNNLVIIATALACHLLVVAMAAPLEETPDPSLQKGKCSLYGPRRELCDMCGSLGLGISRAECCLEEGSYEFCKDGLLMLLDLMEVTSSTIKEPQPDQDKQVTEKHDIDFMDMFPVKRADSLSLSPSDIQEGREKRGNIFSNYNRMWYKGGKRARPFSNYNRMWYKQG